MFWGAPAPWESPCSEQNVTYTHRVDDPGTYVHTHTHTHRHKNAPHTTSSSKFPTIAHERFYPCAVTHLLHQHDGDDMLTFCLAHFLRACAANYNYCVVPESGEDAILFASFALLM